MVFLYRILNIKRVFLFLTVILFSLLLTSCKDDEDWGEDKTTAYVNDWIYKWMDAVYYWKRNLPTDPDRTQKPDKFFESLLYKYNKDTNPDGDRFSDIMPSYVDMLKILSGVTPTDIGFEYTAFSSLGNNGEERISYKVLFVKKNTDAEKKLKRGFSITSVDGVTITRDNYFSLLSANKSSYILKGTNLSDSEFEVTVNVERNYAENPIYYTDIYQVNSKKVGYVMYNFFSPDNGDGSGVYDRALADVFADFYNKNITDLILDLRYNRGGYVKSAIYLASALVPQRNTKKLFYYEEYNPSRQEELINKYGEDYLNNYFTDNIEISPKMYPIPRLGDKLSKLYVLVDNNTASASELVINGLRPYMDVVLVGRETRGKNVGSVTIYEKDHKYNKWGILPIVMKLFNSERNSDYSVGFEPNVKINEFAYPFGQIGDLDNEILLKKALGEITEVPVLDTKVRTRLFENRVVGSSFEQKFGAYHAIVDGSKFGDK